MAVTRVTHTVKGYDAINYVLSGKAHVHNKYVSGRVMASSGINCTVHGCRQQMNAVWRRYGINRPTRRHRRQVQRLIQSFDPQQLNYKKSADVAEANKIGRKLASKLYPHRQSIVVTQADNKHHILHNHIITNMLDFRTGKSMSSRQTNFYYISRVSDNIIKHAKLDPTRHKYMVNTVYGREPRGTQHRTDAEYHIKQNSRYSWVSDIRNKVHKIAKSSTSWQNFIKQGKQHNITIDPYRKCKGKPRIDSRGHLVFKAHITYKFIDKKGRHRTIRDRKLGHAYGKDYLGKVFNDNHHFQIYYNATLSESQRAKVAAQSRKSLIGSYRNDAEDEVQPLIHKQIINSTADIKYSASNSATENANASLSKKIKSLNTSFATSNQKWQTSIQSSLQTSASQSASDSIKASTATLKYSQSSLDATSASFDDALTSQVDKAKSAHNNYIYWNKESKKVKKQVKDNEFEFQNFILQQIQIINPKIKVSDAMGYATGVLHKNINGKRRTGVDFLTNLISSNIEHHINPGGTVQVKNNFADYSKNQSNKNSAFLNSLHRATKTDTYIPDSKPNSYSKNHQKKFNLKNSKYWKRYSYAYYKLNGNRPNSRDKKILNGFHISVENHIRYKERQHNQDLTPKNQIERKINNIVNADPNNADNYTKTWYVQGYDMPGGRGGKELE